LQHFKSFQVGAWLEKEKELSYFDETKQFFMGKELQKSFKHIRLPRLQVDVVNINDILAPK